MRDNVEKAAKLRFKNEPERTRRWSLSSEGNHQTNPTNPRNEPKITLRFNEARGRQFGGFDRSYHAVCRLFTAFLAGFGWHVRTFNHRTLWTFDCDFQLSRFASGDAGQDSTIGSNIPFLESNYSGEQRTLTTD
jgi:hypothetical protein